MNAPPQYGRGLVAVAFVDHGKISAHFYCRRHFREELNGEVAQLLHELGARVVPIQRTDLAKRMQHAEATHRGAQLCSSCRGYSGLNDPALDAIAPVDIGRWLAPQSEGAKA